MSPASSSVVTLLGAPSFDRLGRILVTDSVLEGAEVDLHAAK
jgi:hypothetical protein